MICKFCDVDVKGGATHCPLCKLPLEGVAEGERLFPEVEKVKQKKKLSFSGVYLILLLVGSVAAIIATELVGYPMWALPPIIAGMVGYAVVKGVIIGRGHVGSKFFLLFVLLIALVVAVQLITPEVQWAYTYAIPIMLLIGSIALGVLALTSAKTPATYGMYMLIIAVFGMLPIAIHMAEGEKILLPSIICASGCGTVIIMGLTANFKIIISEIKRKFHV